MVRKTVRRSGFFLCLAALALAGVGCITDFRDREQPVFFEDDPGVSAAADLLPPPPQIPDLEPPAQPALTEPAEPAEAAVGSLEDAAVDLPETAAPEQVKSPWYKRLWPRRARGAEQETAAESESESADEPEAGEVEGEFPEKADSEPDGKKAGEAEPVAGDEMIGFFSEEGAPLIRVGYGLKLSVSAGGRVEVPEQMRVVSDKGEIALPLVGVVACEGLTLRGLSDKLSKLYEQYIRDPQVSVEFIYSGKPGEVSPWGSVMVDGEVRQPGRVNIPPTRDLTLSRAIQLAGGIPKTGNQTDIVVFRREKNGTVRRMVINLLAVAKRGQIDKDILLEPGDSVYVPESIW